MGLDIIFGYFGHYFNIQIFSGIDKFVHYKVLSAVILGTHLSIVKYRLTRIKYKTQVKVLQTITFLF